MLEATQQNISDIATKLKVLEASLSTLDRVHIDDKDVAERIFKRISKRKLVLVDEMLKLIGVSDLDVK